MAAHALDNPVWHALATQHARFAITAAGAARYPAAVAPFAATGEAGDGDAVRLTSLIDDGESVFLLGVAPTPPAGWRLDGYQVISAVCTHPDDAGRGYAWRLTWVLCARAFARGFIPFLHVYSDNPRAIGVYRRVGFLDRQLIPFWAMQHEPADRH